MVQCVTVCCSVLQCVAVCFHVFEGREKVHRAPARVAATHCNTPQHTATHCNTLATHHNTLQHTATHCSTLQHTAAHCYSCIGCMHMHTAHVWYLRFARWQVRGEERCTERPLVSTKSLKTPGRPMRLRYMRSSGSYTTASALHLNESWHVRMSHGTYMNESWHTYMRSSGSYATHYTTGSTHECVVSHMNVSCHIHEIERVVHYRQRAAFE